MSEQISQHASENSVHFVTCGGSVESGMCQMTISAETPKSYSGLCCESPHS